MANQDLERGGTKSRNNYPSAGNYSNPYYVETSENQWTSWLIPMFVVANIAVFIIAMYINNCPKNNSGFEGNCVAKFLGRLSFQPLKENPLFGPSSSTWVFCYALYFLSWLLLLLFIKWAWFDSSVKPDDFCVSGLGLDMGFIVM